MVFPPGGGKPVIPNLGGLPPGQPQPAFLPPGQPQPAFLPPGQPQPAFLMQIRKLIELANKGCPRKCHPEGCANVIYSAPTAGSAGALTRANAPSMCCWCGAYWEVTPEGAVANRRQPSFTTIEKFETEK